MMLYVGNKAQGSLTDFSIAIPEVPYLRMKAQEAPATIAPGQNQQLQLVYHCLQPFADAPSLQLSYTFDNVKHNIGLKLPITVSSFTEAAAMSVADFGARWGALAGSEEQAVVTAPEGASVELEALAKKFNSELHLSTVSSEGSVVWCGGTFRTDTAGANGAKISVGLLVKLEINAARRMFRISVRAVHKQVSLAMKNVISLQLS
jgi:hypothetical protein